MSGLVTETNQKGRGSGLSQGFTFHRFTSTYANWPKPYGCTMLVIECYGAGGGGGGASGNDTKDTGGGGGGGGAMARMSFPAESLGETLTVTIGASGAAGSAESVGSAGGNSSVTDDDSSKVVLIAYGGGGGGYGIGNVGSQVGGGGGGGGTGSVGAQGRQAFGEYADGGNPTIQGSTQGDSLGGRGGRGGTGGPSSTAGSNAEYGGGGGGGAGYGYSNRAGQNGGSSLYGGGGGSGGGQEGGNTSGAAGDWGSYTAGSGAAARGADEAGIAGTSREFGAGGGGSGGGGSDGSGTGPTGGAGGTPSGGGGGGGIAHTGTGGSGGAGARGEVRIWAWKQRIRLGYLAWLRRNLTCRFLLQQVALGQSHQAVPVSISRSSEAVAGAVEVNLLAAMEAVAERWHAVFMTLVRYQQPSLSQLVLVVRLELQGLLTLAASAGHHLLQAADLPC